MFVTTRDRAVGALLSIVASISVSACVNAPDRPEPPPISDVRGTLVVMVRARGNSVDPDGYSASVGGKISSVEPGSPAIFSLPPAPYSVSIGGLAEHCIADTRNANPIVFGNKTDTVSVDVICIGGLAYLEKTAAAESQINYLAENGRTKTLTSGQGRRAILAWSPDGQRIIFSNDVSGHVHLYSVQLDGSGVTQLTTGTTEDSWPRFSPDGARIAYETRDVATASSSIVVMNGDGSNPHTLPTRPTSLGHAWSADGSQLFFSCSFKGGNASLCASAPDGSGLRAIPVPAIDALYAECTASTCVAPAPQGWEVSPDGRKLSFITARSPSLGPQAIWISAIDGSGARIPTLTGALSFSAQWSPTSDWLAIGVYRDPPDPNPFASHGSAIATVKSDGTGYQMLSPGWIDELAPAISPDGTLIAFQFGTAVMVMNPDGTLRHSLTQRGTMSQPAWNPKARPGGP